MDDHVTCITRFDLKITDTRLGWSLIPLEFVETSTVFQLPWTIFRCCHYLIFVNVQLIHTLQTSQAIEISCDIFFLSYLWRLLIFTDCSHAEPVPKTEWLFFLQNDHHQSASPVILKTTSFTCFLLGVWQYKPATITDGLHKFRPLSLPLPSLF